MASWSVLHSRKADGLRVDLLYWDSPSAPSVAIRVDGFGDSQTVEVPMASALDAFHHPFCYLPAVNAAAMA